MGPAPDPIDSLLLAVASGQPGSVYLVAGDLVAAEPAARRLASALAETIGCEVDVRRRPGELEPLIADLQTFSLFAPGKVVLAIDTAVFADRRTAADLVDAAAAVLPLGEPEGELSPRERQAASRLLQALRLFEADPEAGEPTAVLERLPEWAFQGGASLRRGGGRGRGKKQARDLRQGLVDLLAAARRAGLSGMGEGALARMGELIRGGLPERHALVLAESSAAPDHPLVAALAERGAAAFLGRVEEERGGGYQGLDLLVRELERETGVGIAADALSELARRTLRQERGRRGGDAGIDAASTSRLAAEYRKLARWVGARSAARIDRPAVEEAVQDRGEEDVWKLLDAVGEGRGMEALDRLHRLLASAEDALATRLSFFALFADFCRQLVAVRGMMRAAGVPAGERSYPRFKSRWAPALQGDLEAGGEARNPLSGLHPFRLHRAYLAASRVAEEAVVQLPWRLLETELQIKGGSGDPDVALAQLVAEVAALTSGR